MIAAALWLPPSWDWAVWDWMSAQHAPVFDDREIAVVDVPWGADKADDRRRVTAFLNELTAQSRTGRQKPVAVILDIEFGPCVSRPTIPCSPQMIAARQTLITAIAAATQSFAVYAAEQPILDANDTVLGIDAHDPQIYAVITGPAHTKFRPAHPSGVYYRACYEADLVAQDGTREAVSIWDMVARVKMRPGETSPVCDTSYFPVTLPADPLTPAQAALLSLSPQGTYQQNAPAAQFDRKYVIVGTLDADYDPGYVLPDGRRLAGPELLAWALSNALAPGTSSDARIVYDTEPQNGKLLVLVPFFSALTLSAFAAIFYLLKGTRLQTLRRALPWLAALASALVGLLAFAVFEAWLMSSGHIQPQVSLIVLGVLLTAFLSSLRAFQVLFEAQFGIGAPRPENYDYDVFISYAHDEGAWVSENVVAHFRNARVPDARVPGGRKLKIFFDTESIHYGAAWQDTISLAIDGSRFIVPVYSETYFSRPYCVFEIKRAHLNWINAGSDSRIVLPIMRGKPKILSTIRDIQATSIEDAPDLVRQIVAEIVERLTQLGEPKPAGDADPVPAT